MYIIKWNKVNGYCNGIFTEESFIDRPNIVPLTIDVENPTCISLSAELAGNCEVEFNDIGLRIIDKKYFDVPAANSIIDRIKSNAETQYSLKEETLFRPMIFGNFHENTRTYNACTLLCIDFKFPVLGYKWRR